MMLSKFYHPFYIWLGNKTGGRAKAGRNARYGRIGRVIGNMVSLGFITAAIILKGLTPFLEAGAALPLWALMGLCSGIGINLIAWLVSAGANHLKIEQYYDAEMELHAENDELMQKSTRLTGRLRKFAMNSARTLHDMNSLMGTFVGIATGIPILLTLISVSAYAFSPPLAATLFIISRASALASVICVWGTNQFRLWAYKKCLKEEMQIYSELKNQGPDAVKFNIIEAFVNEAFSNLGISEDKTYSQWVKFRCCKALEGAWLSDEFKPSLRNALVDMLQNFLKKFLDTYGELSREKLMHINGPDAPTVSVLDSLLILETQLFEKVSAMLNRAEHQNISTNLSSSYSAKPLLAYHLKRNLLRQENSRDNIAAINTMVLPAPVEVKTAHGSVLLPYYGARKMAEEMVNATPTAQRDLSQRFQPF